MSFISLSEKDKKEMLAKIGISSVEELFQCIPDELKVKQRLDIPEALTEPELTRKMEKMASKNSYHRFLSFLGAGAFLGAFFFASLSLIACTSFSLNG